MNTSKISSASLSVGDVFWFSGYYAKFTGFSDSKTSNGHTYRMVMATWDVPNSSDIPCAMFAIVEGRDQLMVYRKAR